MLSISSSTNSNRIGRGKNGSTEPDALEPVKLEMSDHNEVLASATAVSRGSDMVVVRKEETYWALS